MIVKRETFNKLEWFRFWDPLERDDKIQGINKINFTKPMNQ